MGQIQKPVEKKVGLTRSIIFGIFDFFATLGGIYPSNMDHIKKYWKKFFIGWVVLLILALYFLTNK